jgi:hypothetical protein
VNVNILREGKECMCNHGSVLASAVIQMGSAYNLLAYRPANCTTGPVTCGQLHTKSLCHCWIGRTICGRIFDGFSYSFMSCSERIFSALNYSDSEICYALSFCQMNFLVILNTVNTTLNVVCKYRNGWKNIFSNNREVIRTDKCEHVLYINDDQDSNLIGLFHYKQPTCIHVIHYLKPQPSTALAKMTFPWSGEK